MNVFVLEDILKNEGNRAVFFSYYWSQWCPKTAWLQQNIFLCVQNKHIHTGLSKWWQFHFLVYCLFKMLVSIPVSFLSVLHHQLSELLVHLSVEVISQEEGPEAEERVHLLGLTDAEPLALCGSDRETCLAPGFETTTLQRRRVTHRWGCAAGTCGRRAAWIRSPSGARETGAGTWEETEECSRNYPSLRCLQTDSRSSCREQHPSSALKGKETPVGASWLPY